MLTVPDARAGVGAAKAAEYNQTVPVRPFEPQFMKVGILTAALQELTPREIRDLDPDRAIEDWIQFAAELGAETIQLSAALHPSETDVPPDAMLNPVANTLDLRQPFDATRARRVRRALDAAGVTISDIGYFDNMLHHDATSRHQKHVFMMRTFDAAALLGVDAVCGFVGRNVAHSRHIDRAAACMYALQHEVLPAQGIPVQGRGREPFRS